MTKYLKCIKEPTEVNHDSLFTKNELYPFSEEQDRYIFFNDILEPIYIQKHHFGINMDHFGDERYSEWFMIIDK